MKERIVFHIDVNNAFLSWSAVKLLNEGYKEDIRTIASVIAGDEKERRGIVLAKSPIAKKFHIVTAETLYQARRKCPTLKVFTPDYKWYSQKSKELFTYLSRYSPTMEQFSIDECFIDMTGTNYLYKDYFVGWFYDSNCSEQFISGDEYNSEKIKNDVTLYGKWKEKTNKITFKTKDTNNAEANDYIYFNDDGVKNSYNFNIERAIKIYEEK